MGVSSGVEAFCISAKRSAHAAAGSECASGNNQASQLALLQYMAKIHCGLMAVVQHVTI
jgi:hypothetical protein